METWGRPLSKNNCPSIPSATSNLEIYWNDEINYRYTKDHSKYGIAS